MPRISFAVPAYNCERYIAQSIESLLAQTFGDFELVISDNASTDGTEDICRRYAALDRRVRYVRRDTNVGGPGNFRYVFSLCSAEFHKWSTADDFWDPTYVEKCMRVLDARPDVVLCYSHTRLVNSDGAPIEDYRDNLDLDDPSPRRRFAQVLDRIGLCHAHLGVIRRAAMARTRLIGNERASDAHFLAELALYGKFAIVPEWLFYRRFHEQSSSWNRSSDEHQKKYYAPQSRRAPGLHSAKKFVGLYGAAWRAPIGVGSKLALSSDLARRVFWDRAEVTRDIASAVLPSGR